MDPLEGIKTVKDSSFAMLLAAQKRGWTLYYMQQSDLYMKDSIAMASTCITEVQDDPAHWFSTQPATDIELASLDVILMRKDPPFDMEYITTTYLLEMAEQAGTLIVNKPSSLRDANEKFFITRFPQCCTPMVVSRDQERIRSFINQQKDVIVKPLDGMGGQSIFRVLAGDKNTNVILETVTRFGTSQTMAQRYIPEISQGDKRILLVNGQAIPYALARLPAAGENRGNIAAGASTQGQKLSKRDHWLCEQIGPALRDKGLLFVGIDVIGDYITEINVTSPTCIRELDQEFGLNISAELFNCIDQLVAR